MKQLYPKVSMEDLCGLFGYSRQNYYKCTQNSKKRKSYEESIVEIVKEIRVDQPRLGTIKLQHLINQRLIGYSLGRDQLYDILRSRGLLIRRRKKYKPKLTDGNGESLYPDLRKGLKVNRINQLWCSDITYIELKTKKRHCYLICVTDEYSHLIVGYHLSLRMRTKEVLQAMQMAVNSQLPKDLAAFQDPIIIHSDRGSQYKSKEFQAFTEKYNLICSMAAAGKSHENPVAERLNGILKNELLIEDIFDTFQDALVATNKVIKIYNEKRPHLSCNLLTPQQAHESNSGPLKKLWHQRKKSKRSK